jgi:hypothetical protein
MGSILMMRLKAMYVGEPNMLSEMYVDDSGGRDQPVLVLGGVLATAQYASGPPICSGP